MKNKTYVECTEINKNESAYVKKNTWKMQLFHFADASLIAQDFCNGAMIHLYY